MHGTMYIKKKERKNLLHLPGYESSIIHHVAYLLHRPCKWPSLDSRNTARRREQSAASWAHIVGESQANSFKWLITCITLTQTKMIKIPCCLWSVYGAYHTTLLKFRTACMFTLCHSLPAIRVSMLIFASVSVFIYANIAYIGLNNC